MNEVTTWSDLLTTLVRGQDVDAARTRWAMDRIMSGEAAPAHVAGFLVALRAKGETTEEVLGLADEMLAHSRRFTVPGRSVDIVGTGGDRLHTVNVSTMAALVVAGTGLRVVKHGNRAASSSSGSADVLETLGVRLDLPVERVAALAEEVGITFCFALVFHPAMRHVAPVRRDLGIATVFNFLGPLTNPAQPSAAAIGVADARMAPILAGVLARRRTDALVFRGERDGLDELAATGPSRIWEVRGGEVREEVVDWAAEGFAPVTVDELRGADAAYNAGVVERLLAGEPGPVRETVLLNAAAAIVADGTLPGTGQGTLVERLRAGVALAAAAVDGGAAADVLARWREASA
ncbi:anthranilate phosphoribosyltransferase [Cellulomonas oligotrophica]|uniref:Anthranilate phosphoribosyltransferase n=1 Tax=Cellulomonas oligotrophica TaxID=931536 RepID=A0A7Y9FD08_9CELL|nr:anthranilate phosphoribosyltransferase [Cellulomonas oligotrophica]NYD84975.1 anthranilate phosphoribosyltransferase [Cellulomonas oligotrophica]GIG34611.1 anthranilate phosphoribosyltransferase 1 [Cellulomonas oligotrophica]